MLLGDIGQLLCVVGEIAGSTTHRYTDRRTGRPAYRVEATLRTGGPSLTMTFFAKTARALVASGVRRLVVAGGETSGAAVSGLELEAVTIGPEIDPGVPALRSEGDDKMGLALKSGNFGSEDFFEKALARLEAGA